MQNYRIEGDLPIRFVIEMGLGACISEWMPVARRLKRFGGVLLYERYGINRSECAKNDRTPVNIAEELHDLLSALQCEKEIVLIAHSQGGLYANQYVRRYPDTVQALILLDPLSPKDNLFKERLTAKEYKKSGVDKSGNLILMDSLAKYRLGWLTKKIMKSAPPLYYSNEFTGEEMEDILGCYTNRPHLQTAYREYTTSHNNDCISHLADVGTFPDIPMVLITHDSKVAIEESMQFGNNTREFAERVENMWQDLMKEYLSFSRKSTYFQCVGSGHFIHLTNPDMVVEKAYDMLNP